MLAVSLDGLARLNWLSVPVNRLARLNLAVTLRYLRSLCGLGWLRRWSLLSLCGYVGVRLRLHGYVRVGNLWSRVRARGLRTGVRTLCRSLPLGCEGLRCEGLRC